MPVAGNNNQAYSLAAYSAAAAVLAISATYGVLTATQAAKPISREVILSPRTTLLPRLNQAQKNSLGYPPDALPGARDVATPYGSMRVYEWGPADGRKVLMIHGDATPSPLFGPIANELVARGCRVLTFDSWGRGYSDTPVGSQHNSRLYTQQILYALTSSPIHWTGPTRFSVVGFSMGGAITLDFFAHQPSLVDSIVLLGPAGMLRKLPAEYKSFFFRYPALVSKSAMRRLVGTMLGVDLKSPAKVEAEKEPAGFTPVRACQFQFDHHAGHVESLLSNVQYGPIQDQGAIWKKAGDIISGKVKEDTPLCGSQILVICGEDDNVVPAADVKEDMQKYIGEEGKHWVFGTVPGDHGFPWSEGVNVGKAIAEFWNLK